MLIFLGGHGWHARLEAEIRLPMKQTFTKPGNLRLQETKDSSGLDPTQLEREFGKGATG